MTHLFLNREHCIVGALVEKPHNQGWGGVHDNALAAIDKVSVKLKFEGQGKPHKYGN